MGDAEETQDVTPTEEKSVVPAADVPTYKAKLDTGTQERLQAIACNMAKAFTPDVTGAITGFKMPEGLVASFGAVDFAAAISRVKVPESLMPASSSPTCPG